MPGVKPLIVIAGPTASGKTAAAVALARRIDAEIISADSMQVYRRLSIGTGKPTADELGGVPYHLIDCVDPDTQYNAGRFVAEADALIGEIRKRGRPVIVCGGTGLYIKALLEGTFDGLERDESVREALSRELEARGLAALYEELCRLDPDAGYIMPGDGQRILRALEVVRATGKPLTAWHRECTSRLRHPHVLFVLTPPRDWLAAQIDRRVDSMLDHGLLEEVQNYLSDGLPVDNPAFCALGYGEIAAHLRGQTGLDAAVGSMKTRTRKYAKRQMTWFRGAERATFVGVHGQSTDQVAGWLESLTRLRGGL